MSKNRILLFLSVMLLLSAACKKDGHPGGQQPPPPVSPLLKNIIYTDQSFDSTFSIFDYDGNRRLQKYRINFTILDLSGAYYFLYARTGNQIGVRSFNQDDVEVTDSAATYILNAQGFIGSYLHKSFDNDSQRYLDYKDLYEYTPDQYLKKISSYKVSDNSLVTVHEYYYSAGNRLDSIAGFRSLGNNNSREYEAWTFEYDGGIKNTIGNGAMSTSLDNWLDLGGKGQSSALSKETYSVFNSSQIRRMVLKNTYRNEADDKGLMTRRTGAELYYFPNGSVGDSAAVIYSYKYQ